jgi:hypothetical protein
LAEEIKVVMAMTAASVKNVFKGEQAQKTAMQQAELEARAGAPLIETSKTEGKVQSAMDAINASKEATASAAREKYGTPGASPTGMDILQKPTTSSALSLISTSAAKVGALGGAAWGMDQGLSVQREQLSVQTRMANSIDAFLKAAQPVQNPFLGSVTPQLGVI